MLLKSCCLFKDFFLGAGKDEPSGRDDAKKDAKVWNKGQRVLICTEALKKARYLECRTKSFKKGQTYNLRCPDDERDI